MAQTKYHREKFYSTLRKLVVKKLSQSQVDSINAILEVIEDYDLSIDHAAYVLSTAWHESRFTPVRETFATSDKQAVARLNKHYRRKVGTKRCYWCQKPHYFGRGFVQLTWKFNYKTMGEELGVDLVNKPSLAMRPDIAAKVLVRGMVKGMFTGKGLKDYKSFYQMRRIVNGTDKAKTFAATARKMVTVLNASRHIVEQPVPVPVPVPVVPTPEPSRPTLPEIDHRFDDVFEVIHDQKDGRVYIEVARVRDHEPTTNVQPLMEFNMAETFDTGTSKHAFRSKTFWGVMSGLVTLLGPAVFGLIGYDIDRETATALGNHGLAIIQILLGVFSTGLTLFGRASANKSMHFIPKIKIGQ